ncbi:MAG TPA: S8 family serine peptidase [bacterium]|nr:S8 family serine peptidase [bacterium]
MRSLLRFGSMIVAVMFVASGYAGVHAAPTAGDVIPGEYIVVFKDWVTNATAEARALAAQHNASVKFTYEHALKGFAGTIPAAKLAQLRRDPRVAFITQNRVVEIAAQTLPTGVNRMEADVSPTAGIDGFPDPMDINVAIIDTGIQTNHPDLNVLGGHNCMSSDPNAWGDGNGHGTHVAGTVGARDNGIGVVGVAPDARLWAVRVLGNDGSGTTANVVCGINWVTANAGALGIKVANMSLGGGGADDGNCGLSNGDAMHVAICNSVAARVTYAVAAGNSNTNMQSQVPAAYDEVLTVTAVADFNGVPGGGGASTCFSDVDDTNANFSNFAGASSVADQNHTIAGPGVCIFSTWLGSAYATISGTSMASPHIAGVVALCLQGGACTGLTPAQIIAKLRNDAAARDSGNTYGFVGDPNSPGGGSGGKGVPASSPANEPTATAAKGPGGGGGGRYYGFLVFAGNY